MISLIYFKVIALYVMAFFLTSCATYQMQVDQSRKLMNSGKYEAALERLKPLASKYDKDQLVYALDYAMALQIAGKYEESTKYFLLADEIVKKNDYLSISKMASSVLLNEEMLQYKGDEYERLLINTMLAINFASVNDLESARVETKKSLEKVGQLKRKGKNYHSANPFVMYLNGIIWEANRDWDDAYIDYLNVYKSNPNFTFVQKDLMRVAQISGRQQELNKWKNKFKHKLKDVGKNQAEVILIFQQGWGPRKQPSYQDAIIPVLRGVPSRFRSGILRIDGYSSVPTEKLFNIESASINALHEQVAPLLAKRLASIAAKKVIAHQVYKKNKGLGVLSDILMSATERADLRQWSLLPKTLQIARLSVEPGEHNVSVEGQGRNGKLKICDFKKILVKKNEKKIITCRGF